MGLYLFYHMVDLKNREYFTINYQTKTKVIIFFLDVNLRFIYVSNNLYKLSVTVANEILISRKTENKN